MSKLVIVESPAKAKTIGKYLGADYVVKASMGHLRDLPKQKMSVDIEHDFTPFYAPIQGKDKIIAELQSEISKSDFVYLATDPDREGEAISWHLKELFQLPETESKRVTFNEITRPAVKYGIEHPRDIDLDLVNAQQARRILDRIVGYELSPFLWRKVKRGLSAGRVQSVATRLVVDRENEIRAFIPEEYWTIEATLLSPHDDNFPFTARFYGDKTGKIEIKTEEEANHIVTAITGQPFVVDEIKKGKKKRAPAPPFITSTLQQEASRKLNMTPKRTMSVAQSLYEGVELGDLGLTGLITYMRTDSLRLSDEATAAAATFIRSRYGDVYYPGKPRTFKTKSGAQDAHEAIRPSDVNLVPEDIKAFLNPDQFKLYKLIWSRFVACQMADALFDTLSVDLLTGGYVFRTSGHTIAFPGFLSVYEEGRDDDKDESSSKLLPHFELGDSMMPTAITPAQHFTQPPARYTEATLIRAMEERGIGRPSTYAPTISTIIDRYYVMKENRSLRPTPLGEGVTQLLVDKFQYVADYEFTAIMEQRLDEVEAGKLDYVSLLHHFYDGFEGALKQAEIDLEGKRVKIQDEVTDVICDKCGKNMVIKVGRFGRFLACPGFPECTNTKAITEDTGASCPVCGAKVVKKKSARGYVYYSCDKYPECSFMTWDKPLKTRCPECESSLFRHTDRDSKEVKDVCLREGCGYAVLVKEGLPPEEAEKNRQRREARAAKAAERAAKKAEQEAAKAAEEKARKAKRAAERRAEKRAAAKAAKEAALAAEQAAAGAAAAISATANADTNSVESPATTPKKTTRKTTTKTKTAAKPKSKKVAKIAEAETGAAEPGDLHTLERPDFGAEVAKEEIHA